MAERTVSVEQFVEAFEGIMEELARREPEAYRKAKAAGSGVDALLTRHPDLQRLVLARLDAIAERAKHVRVKTGDWVTINGVRFQVGLVDSRTGSVSTRRLDRNFQVVSSDWIEGWRLTPDATPPTLDELEPTGPACARERLERHAAQLVPQQTPVEGQPPPLRREGRARIAEVPWTNPLPERPLSPALLSRYWQWLLETRSARRRQLDEAAQKPSRAPGSSSYHRWHKERIIQIHYFEAVLELLHRIIEPDAPTLCGADCSHVARGVTPQQLQRFIGSLEAFRATTDYESEENYTVERAQGTLRDLQQGSRQLSRRDGAGFACSVWQLMLGAEEEDHFEVRVVRDGAVLEVISCATSQEAHAQMERRAKEPLGSCSFAT